MKNRTHNVVLTVMATLLIASGSILLSRPVQAATDSVYLAPSTGTYNVGDNVSLAVHEDSGSTGVYTTQIGLSYPQNLLQYVSVDASDSAFSVSTGMNTGGNGHVEIIQGSTSPITNDQLVADVNFKVLASGSATVSFDPVCQNGSVENCTAALDVNSNNVLTSAATSTFTLQSPAPQTCPSGQTGTPPNCTTTSTTTASSSGNQSTNTATTTAATTDTSTTAPTPADPSDLPNTGAGNVILPAVAVSVLGYAGYLLRLKRHAA